MNSNNKLLNYTDHGTVKITDGVDLSLVKHTQLIPLVVHEFSITSASIPIVFVKNSTTGAFQPMALVGFKENENLLIKHNQWQASYIPQIIKQAPFMLAPHAEDNQQLQLVINENSALCSENNGKPLFDEQGKESHYLQQRKKQLSDYYQHIQITQDFTQTLANNDLLQQQNLTIDFKKQKISLDGLYLVNETALNQLSNEDFIKLRHKGYLAPIYHHLAAMHQLTRLVTLHEQTL